MDRIPKIGDRVYVGNNYYNNKLIDIAVTITDIDIVAGHRYCHFQLPDSAPEDLKRGWYASHNFDMDSIIKWADDVIVSDIGYEIY